MNTARDDTYGFESAVRHFGKMTAHLIYWKTIDNKKKTALKLNELVYLFINMPLDSQEEAEVLNLMQEKITFKEGATILRKNFSINKTKRVKFISIIEEKAKTIRERTVVWFWKHVY